MTQGIKQEIGERLLQLRKKLGLSQLDMATHAQLSRTYIGHVENGIQNPSFAFLVKIARTFNISVDWLLFGSGQMELLPDDHYLNNLNARQLDFLKKFNTLPETKQNHLLNVFDNIIDIPG